MNNRKNKIKRPHFVNPGFTLVEMLVAVSVFVILSLVLIEVYVITQKGQAKVAGESLVISEGRHILEAIVREARTGIITYDYYGGTVGSVVNELALEDSAGNDVVFKKGIKGDGTCSNDSNCVLYNINSTGWSKLTPDEINISRLDFYIYPSVFNSVSVDQPRVTVVLTLNNVAAKLGEQSTVSVQTTASSRVYR